MARIFIAGASGYIGGSLAAHLHGRGHDVVGLVRDEEKAGFLRQHGIIPVIGSLTDRATADAARAADVTVNTAEADNADLVRPLLAALEGSGKAFIHTSGSSIVVDDAEGGYAGDTIIADDQPFAVMPYRQPRVDVDVMVRSAGITGGIRAAAICPSLIYGQGRGWKCESHQLPILIAKSTAVGAGVCVGAGAPIWSNVFLDDLLDLYARAIDRAPSGTFFFVEAGESSWFETAEAISRSLGFNGHTATWPLEAAIAEAGGVARVALATNCRIRATNARRLLGWSPVGPGLADTLSSG